MFHIVGFKFKSYYESLSSILYFYTDRLWAKMRKHLLFCKESPMCTLHALTTWFEVKVGNKMNFTSPLSEDLTNKPTYSPTMYSLPQNIHSVPMLGDLFGCIIPKIGKMSLFFYILLGNPPEYYYDELSYIFGWIWHNIF